MKFIYCFILLLVAICKTSCNPGSYHNDHFAPANYKFEYSVSDPHTGDKKSQYEHRHGDDVKGAYSLHEPDGTIRVVEYTSGPHSGFNAIVKRIGHAHHPQVYKQYGGASGYGGHGGGQSYVGSTHWGFGKHY